MCRNTNRRAKGLETMESYERRMVKDLRDSESTEYPQGEEPFREHLRAPARKTDLICTIIGTWKCTALTT